MANKCLNHALNLIKSNDTPQTDIHKSILPAPIQSAPQKNQAELLMQQGLALHQQGKLKEAQVIYEQILAIQVNHFGAVQLLGALFAQSAEFIKAIEFLRRALQINPNFVEAHYNLGVIFQELMRFDEALASYDQAISIKPDNAHAYFNCGIIMYQLMRFDEAIANYDKAIGINPKLVEAYSNRGNTLKELMRFDEALDSYDQAISIDPNLVEAYSNRGNTLKELNRLDEAIANYDQAIHIKSDYAEAYSNRGNTLKELNRLDEAITNYDQAIHIKPDYAEAYYNRGNTLKELNRLYEAIANYDQAIHIKPDYAEAYYNRGVSLQELKLLDQALASYDQAISIKPDYAEAYSNRGIGLQELNRLDQALASYDQAISSKPDYAEAYWNLSLCYLMGGNFKDGWQNFEWRWKSEDVSKHAGVRFFSQPLWLGLESLKDKTILLYAEQGLGDTIQFCRYAQLVAQLSAKVILEVQPPLLKLLKSLEGVGQFIAKGEPLPAFDFQCPLMSLPLALKTELKSIPLVAQHITPDSEMVEKWKTKLGKKVKPRVGFVWSGSTGHKNDQNRSLTLSQLLPYLPSNIECVCLQKELRDIDRELLSQHAEIKYFGDALEDFTDTAALCELMDVVISVDTSVAHLAGTLGKPTWILLPFSPDWRWLLDRNDSPWYPMVTLYRQKKAGDWSSVLEKVKVDLTKLAAQPNT